MPTALGWAWIARAGASPAIGVNKDHTWVGLGGTGDPAEHRPQQESEEALVLFRGRLRGGACPRPRPGTWRPPDPLSSALRPSPSSIPSLPGLHFPKLQLLPWAVIFHSRVLWEANVSRSSSSSFLPKRQERILLFF